MSHNVNSIMNSPYDQRHAPPPTSQMSSYPLTPLNPTPTMRPSVGTKRFAASSAESTRRSPVQVDAKLDSMMMLLQEIRNDVRRTNDRIDGLEKYITSNLADNGRQTAPVNKSHEVGKIAARLLLCSDTSPITLKDGINLVVFREVNAAANLPQSPLSENKRLSSHALSWKRQNMRKIILDSIDKGSHIEELVSDMLVRLPSPATIITYGLRGKLALMRETIMERRDQERQSGNYWDDVDHRLKEIQDGAEEVGFMSPLMRYLWRDIQRFKTKASTDNCASYIRANYPAAIERPVRLTPTQNNFELTDEYGDGSENYEEDFNEVEDLDALFVAEDLDLD